MLLVQSIIAEALNHESNNAQDEDNDNDSKTTTHPSSIQSSALPISQSISIETPFETVIEQQEEKDIDCLQNDKQSEHSFVCLVKSIENETKTIEKEPLSNRDILPQNGYEYIKIIQKTLQGVIIKAKRTNDDNKNEENEYVAIKVTNKNLHKLGISIQENGDNVCVEENIIKEASILKYLTFDNQMTADYIVRYIDMFQDKKNYYLVMEYVDGITLTEFVNFAHKYLKCKKLDLKYFKKVSKYIAWQICAILYYIHSMKVAHLKLSDFNNIMIVNGDFIQQKDGSVSINPEISIKICDFGMSELYINHTEKYECYKTSLVGKPHFKSPQEFDERIFNPFKADIWSVGIILFLLSTGSIPLTFSTVFVRICLGFHV